MVVVIVVAARRELVCPECGLSTKAGYEVDRPVVSRWRHLDLGSSEGGGPRPAPVPKTRAGDKADGPGARRHPARAQMTEQTPTRGSQPAGAPSRRHRVVVTRPRHHHVLEQPAHRGDAAVHRRWRHSLAVPQANNLASRLSPRSSRLLRSRDSRTGQWAPHQRGPSPARPGTVRSSTDRTATVRAHRDGIAAASERGLSNGLIEGLRSKVRLIIRRLRVHSADAALVMLSCGPVGLLLPHGRLHLRPRPRRTTARPH